MEIKEGDLIKIDINKIMKYDNIQPYIQLLKKVIKNSEGKPYVSKVNKDDIDIRAWKYDIQGDVTIPRNSVIKVVGNDLNYELKQR